MSRVRVAKNVVDRIFCDIGDAVPWTVHAEWSTRPRVNKVRLRRAAEVAMLEHPLLRARQGPDPTSWELRTAPQEPPLVCTTVSDAPSLNRARDDAVSRRFDLTTEPPVRFHLVETPDGDNVVVVGDHAVVDGIGVGRVALSLAERYAADARPAIEDESWRQAHALDFRAPSGARAARSLETLLDRARPTSVRLVPEADGPCQGYGVVYHQMTKAARAALEGAPAGAATINDRVIAAFCLACMDWNRATGAPVLPFSVGIPLNLRPARRWYDSVCNATVPWPVRLDDDRPTAVLQQVSAQLAPVRLGIYSPTVRAVIALVRGRNTLPVRVRHALATTTVVSTVPVPRTTASMPPSAFSGAQLYGGAPTPSAMGITFAVMAQPGNWHYSARFLRARFTRSGVTRLLASVDDAVLELAGQQKRKEELS